MVSMDCQTPPRKRRSSSPVPSVSRLSAKRRRLSGIPRDIPREFGQDASSRIQSGGLSDRFIPARRDITFPLYTSPRTNRMAQFFGMKDDRVLKFADPPYVPPLTQQSWLQRYIVSSLYYPSASVPSTSALSNLGNHKQALMALDGSGISSDIYAYPLTWSHKNVLAVACENDIFYQNLTTRAVSRLGTVPPIYGRLRAIEWTGVQNEDTLAVGTAEGTIQVWNVVKQTAVRNWIGFDDGVGGASWNGHVLAFGKRSGTTMLYDDRLPHAVGELHGHKSRVHGVKWSWDKKYLATSDDKGHICIWDHRASRVLSELFDEKRVGRMKQKAPVKALAWCPWNLDLLATGSTYPGGSINIWSIKSATASISPDPPPLQTLALNTSVTSLHWSPHCMELLSTHGYSWTKPTPEPRNARGSESGPASALSTQLSNSIAVHRYPSCTTFIKAKAHSKPIGHSCLSPDGTSIFTVCPSEENMKLWRIWGVREEEETENTMSQKYSIR